MQTTTIYVGLNDAETHAQKFDTSKYLTILKGVCHAYRVGFSVQLVNGGYFHEDGSYVEENTLSLTLMDVPEDTVRSIAEDLCAFFRQESVLVSVSRSEVYFVKERLKDDSSEI